MCRQPRDVTPRSAILSHPFASVIDRRPPGMEAPQVALLGAQRHLVSRTQVDTQVPSRLEPRSRRSLRDLQPAPRERTPRTLELDLDDQWLAVVEAQGQRSGA